MDPRVAIAFPSSSRGARGSYRRTFSDFLALDRALMADDLVAAQEAFARLQDDSIELADAVSRHPFPSDTPHVRALKDLGRALIDGDLMGAKKSLLRFH
ncbi:MAG TPA: hypothetical protein VHD32_17210 [Candidatus Didemnitutus sp.]|nr:hypothetical protein [Candidatus Didemnitutus sp.]